MQTDTMLDLIQQVRDLITSQAENDSHSTYDVRYDREVDPDRRILDLEMRVARLELERMWFSSHRYPCDGQGPCTCAWDVTVRGELWTHVGDSEDLGKAIASWNDDAVAARARQETPR